jgi:primosomal protein N' (replication factor Y)
MGSIVEAGRVQGGCQTLTSENSSVAAVVPDVTGIDKQFDYAVPDGFGPLRLGDRVRIDLNGRRVGGWVVGLSSAPSEGIDPNSLRPLAGRSGAGVEPGLIELCRWVGISWCGPFRAVLASASSPTVRLGTANARRGRVPVPGDDPVSRVAAEMCATGGGCLRVPPLASALSVVSAVADRGPVLVICPTHRMASLGAASLRRKGLGVAVVPDEWAVATAGADVVIGTRSAVFAPCPGLSTIVVIDEHDEALKEERSPAWDATSVALERGRREGVPVLTTSPAPSAAEHERTYGPGLAVDVAPAWPRVVVEDLSEERVSGTLLGSHLLEAARKTSGVTLAILNTKGRARLLACRACSALQRCSTCRSLLSETDGVLTCERCVESRGTVCLECGRTAFRVLKSGTAGLCTQIERSTGVGAVEVTSSTSLDDLRGGLFVGTEALLRRVDNADVVVFCDVDRDLGAPRVTAPREVLADIARAARVVGARGLVVVQTRDPEHPLLRCLAARDIDDALAEWLSADVELRRTLGMPPFSVLVRFSSERALAAADAPEIEGVEWSVSGESLVARLLASGDAGTVAARLADHVGLRVRVHVGPSRY